jgi:D-tyrosyl-tRNA(Tyr) deacylase
MIALIQRVKSAKVIIEEKEYSKINRGYVILVGFCQDDNEKIVLKMAEKIANLRIMADENGKMNLNIYQVKGEILVVSQFTLCADTSQRRPSFIKALEQKKAEKLYQLLINQLKEKNIPVKTGKFGCYMQVEIVNDGPVTIILDSRNFK